MKKWTVMLIPHDRSNTQMVTLSGWHFTAVVGLMVLLSFVATFMFAREQALQAKTARLRDLNRQLELRASAAASTPAAQPAKNALSEAQVREAEARARAEYDKSISTITTELQQLYEMETKARSITGMAPRKTHAVDFNAAKAEDGKGGGVMASQDQGG